ncbi:tRNA(Glu)-specific nuclease WapA precursor [Oxobacter pfennigii]|uniref:tRNA(Glu)-specific nuclease WapA n=1 Tax=Oxobacter pfennigii TaxID=36849 RepID=A0A0N8NTP2_9CLOT|nr:DNRLRE domain-containing protein [Oxobacter pfennigii]KPU45384.1 tRNA(Glu)-specific nuclease WapA precursor [Oxobacter pfennigii]
MSFYSGMLKGNSNLPAREVKVNNEAKILNEVEEKRQRNIKHFLRDDGTYEAAIYPSPVHYLSNGKYKDIDNNLIDSSDEMGNPVLENKENEYKVKISKNTRSKKLVQLTKDNYELSWNIQGIRDTSPSVVRWDSKFLNSLPETDRLKTLTRVESSADLKSILPGIDIKYNVRSDRFKENIIINQNTPNLQFIYNIYVKNLGAKLSGSTIVFYDIVNESNEIFIMGFPYMIDSKKNESTDILISLKASKEGYTLTVIPDNNWLNSVDRIYPVTIDPYVETPQDPAQTFDSYVGQNTPSEWVYASPSLKVGYNSTDGQTRSYIRFTLPQLTAAETIYSANLALYLTGVSAPNSQIDVHKVLNSWSSSSITWNGQPGADAKIEEFQIVSAAKFYYFDVTGMVKDWYNSGNNYGLVLKHHTETTGPNTTATFSSSDASSSNLRPQITIYYVNNNGLESYWTYHSQDVGRAGTGYVNDYTGNLVFVHNDLSMNGNRMPVTINHVYNSNDKGADIGYGPGWRLNLTQTVQWKQIPAGGVNYYMHTDEDGTNHYYRYDSEKGYYVDDAGTDFMLTVTGSGESQVIRITDKGGNKLNFDYYGILRTIEDKNGNKITLTYNNNRLTEVEDGAGRKTTLTYTESGHLFDMTDPAGRKTDFRYTVTRLTSIIYSYENNNIEEGAIRTTFSYDGIYNLTSAMNYDGYKINYSYYDRFEPGNENVLAYRIKQIQETHTDSTLGNELNIIYGKNNTTFTDFKDRKNIYQFNNIGNTISIKDADDSAQHYRYGDIKNKNKLTVESKLQRTVINLLKNHSVEEPYSEWAAAGSTVGTVSSEGSGIFTEEDKYMGKMSLKIVKTNTVGRHYFSQKVTLIKGKMYTLSGYVKTNGVTAADGKGVVIYATYELSGGDWPYQDSQYINGTNDWQRVEVTFTLPDNALNTTVYIGAGIYGVTGTAYFDNLQLEEGPVANRYNLVENPSFGYVPGDSGNGPIVPLFWEGSFNDTEDGASGEASAPIGNDDTSVKIVGYGSVKKWIRQKINISGNKGDSFIIGGWAKADSIPLTPDSLRYFALDLQINRTDVATPQYAVVNFNDGVSDWQYASDRIIADGPYDSIMIYAIYYNNANIAYFDGIQVYREEFGTSFTYDENGNVVSIVDLANQTSKFQYNSNNDLVNAADPKGNNFQYTYDEKRNIKDATSAENVVYSFVYDSYGNPKTAKVGDSTLFIESASTYSTDGNYAGTVSDPLGNTVIYNYNDKKGTLDSIIDPKGNPTIYSYDINDRITDVTKTVGGKRVEYFPLNSGTAGSLGTKAAEDKSAFATDGSPGGRTYLSSYAPTKVLYNLGINKNSGTMTILFKTTGSGDRTIIANEASDREIFNLYINSQDFLRLLVRKSDSSDIILAPTNITIQKNRWYFAALRWSMSGNDLNYTVFLDSNSYPGTIGNFKSYKNFTGARTGIGNSIPGIYQLNGFIERFTYSPNSLSDSDIALIRQGSDINEQKTPVTNSYSYDKDRIKTITHNGFNYSFEYDSLGNNTAVSAGGNTLITNEYQVIKYDNNKSRNTGLLSKSTYGNGQIISMSYDTLDRISARYFNGVMRHWYSYDASGSLGYHNDIANGTIYRYAYDLAGRLSRVSDSKGNVTGFGYDLNNNGNKLAEQLNKRGYITSHVYSRDNRPLHSVYNRYLYNDGRIEYFPLNVDSEGTKGTKPLSFNAVFDRDKDYRQSLMAYEGSTNLLTANSSFEDKVPESGKIPGWEATDWNTVKTGRWRIVNDGVNGGKSIECYDSQADGIAANAVAYQNITLSSPLDGATDYTMSAYAKRIGDAQPQLSLVCYNSSGSEIPGAYWTYAMNIEQNQWVRISGKFTAPAGTKILQVIIRSPVKDKDIVRFDDVQMEKKPFATPYTPAASTSTGTKISYSLGVNKASGTMGVWFYTAVDDTVRLILSNEGTNKQIFNMYIDSDNYLKLNRRNNAGTIQDIVSSAVKIEKGIWYFAAFRWNYSASGLKCTLYLNGTPYTHSTNITDFQDFTGGVTLVGSTISGTGQANGAMQHFMYSGQELSNAEIGNIYNSGRGNDINNIYDSLGRLKSRTLTMGANKHVTRYGYEEVQGTPGATTTRLKSIDINNTITNYTYDKNGNIEKVTIPGGSYIEYFYDELNQLIRENNQITNVTTVYTYDAGGNILTRTEYSFTTGPVGTATKEYIYTYDDPVWKDKLKFFTTKINNVTTDKSISYDDVGNITAYDGYTYTWEGGRQLKSISGNGKTIEFKYNDAGIRTQKTVYQGTTTPTVESTTKYHLVGDKVTYEIKTDADGKIDTIYYTYDSAGKLASMNLNGVEYFYIRNGQGDITGLFNKNGTQVVSYTYDTWGKLISIKDQNGADVTNDVTHVGYKNPYRYRGYRYDTETGLYYLQSRYYNPEWCRFINADIVNGTIGGLLSHNLFSYCNNNPVNREDQGGNFWAEVAALGVSIGAVIASAPVWFVAVMVLATVVTVGLVGYIGVWAYDNYINPEITYKEKSIANVKTDSKGRPIINVKGKKNWKEKALPKNYKEGPTIPSSDMDKTRIVDESGNTVGEMHRGQPEYKYNPYGTKTPTGRVWPDHWHLNSDPKMHYLPK